MKNKKVLFLSALSAALGLTLAGGATYALFTSDAKTDITVTSGKVKVAADVQNIKMYSGEWDETAGEYKSVEVTGTFTNGGTAAFANGVLSLDRLTPMDRVEFDIVVANESNINIKYRSYIKNNSEPNALTDALKVSFAGAELEGSEFYSPWELLEVDEQPTTMHIVIELPESAGNDALGLECQLTYGVEATQGNAKTEQWVNPDGITYISSLDGLLDFAEKVNSGESTFEGKKVKLLTDIDLEGVEWTPIGGLVSYPSVTFAGTFDGCGHTISNMETSDFTPNHATAGFFGSTTGAVKNLTIKDFKVESSHYAGAIVGYSSSFASNIENCKAINGTVTTNVEWLETEYDNGDKAGAIMGLNSEGASITGCTVENVTVKGYRDLGGVVGASSGVISNNKVKDVRLIQDDTNGYKTSITTVHEIVGNDLGATLTNNETENVSIAMHATMINSLLELQAFEQAVNGGNTYYGKTVLLNADIDLEGVEWKPIGNLLSYPSITFAGIFDGCGHTISNMKTSDFTPNHATAGFFGSTMGTVKNLTIKDFEVKSSHYAGGIVAYASSSASIVENCKVINGTITSTPEDVGGEYDNGDKVGGIFGFNGEAASITGCLVENVTVKAYRDLGGIVGATSGVISGNTVKNSTICQSNVNAYKTSIDTYGKIYGRNLGGATFTNNVEINVTIVNE